LHDSYDFVRWRAWMDDRDTADVNAAQTKLHILGEFGISVRGQPLTLPRSAQRILVALAMRPEIGDRTVLGTMLYPEARRNRISASLRSALWRVKREAGENLVRSRGQQLHLVESVAVDLHHWTRRARMLILPEGDGFLPDSSDIHALSQELLPSWDEPWLELDQQRWDQLRLHALECMAERFSAMGLFVDALEAGLAAVSIEPFRESAHRAVIKAFIAEGNGASAVAQYHRYHRLVTRELGLRPTAQLQALVRGLTQE
jgi:DNA-binding SARP family transcriptional activator